MSQTGEEVYQKNSGFRSYVLNNQTLRSIDDSIREKAQNKMTDQQIENGLRNPLRPKRYTELTSVKPDPSKNVFQNSVDGAARNEPELDKEKDHRS